MYVAFVAAGSPGDRSHRSNYPGVTHSANVAVTVTGSPVTGADGFIGEEIRHHRAATSPTPPSPPAAHLACTTVDSRRRDRARCHFNVTANVAVAGSTYVHVDGNVPHFKPSANVAVTVTS